MNALFVTSEAAPYCKTGGLGDVCGALPRELEKLGSHPIVMLPYFRQARVSGLPAEPTGVRVEIPIGQKLIRGEFLRGQLPDSNVPVYLLDQPDYYDRPQPYRDEGQDYQDNCERFTFFCRSVVEGIEALGLDVDLVHCHDWCAGLIPIYLKTLYRDHPVV
ncbi:MAG: glycogen/starch synthase, partial [Planctomycetales bacterium]|nr:glycogen/starch synthase [Planctomycetales bacterium]